MAKPRFGASGRVLGGPGGHQARKLVSEAAKLGYRVEVRLSVILLFPPNGGKMISLHLTQLRSGPGYHAILSRIKRGAKPTIRDIK